MILDALLQLSNAQSFSGSGAVSANTVDLGNPTIKRRIGTGTGVSVVFVVTTGAAGDSGSMTDTFDFSAVQDTAANLATAANIITRRVPGAQLVPGAIVQLELPVGTPTARYLGARLALGTGDTVSASCFVVPTEHVPQFTAYAKGYAV